MDMSNLHLNDFFSKLFHDQLWTIDEPSVARYGRHGIAMAIDGPPGNVMSAGELHWSLSTGCLIRFFTFRIFYLTRFYHIPNLLSRDETGDSLDFLYKYGFWNYFPDHLIEW